MHSSSSSASPPNGASCCSSRIRTTWSPTTASVRVSRSVCRNFAARSSNRGASPYKGRSRMRKLPHKPVLFFDFDNTLTQGDLLDELIERYSPNEEWRDWEHAWAEGQLPARECLRLQIENMRVSRAELFDFLGKVRIDPAFVDIVHLARNRRVAVNIVSDSFQPLISHVLKSNGVEDNLLIFANEVSFAGDDRLVPYFPHYDPACLRSANAKARHLAPYRMNKII